MSLSSSSTEYGKMVQYYKTDPNFANIKFAREDGNAVIRFKDKTDPKNLCISDYYNLQGVNVKTVSIDAESGNTTTLFKSGSVGLNGKLVERDPKGRLISVFDMMRNS